MFIKYGSFSSLKDALLFSTLESGTNLNLSSEHLCICLALSDHCS